VADKKGAMTLYLPKIPPKDDSEEARVRALKSAERKTTANKALAIERAAKYNDVPKEEGRQYMAEISVPVMSLHDVISESGLKRITIVQIDAEGYDWNILRQLDIGEFKPALINFECIHLDGSSMRQAEAWLRENGYMLFHHGRDCCAIRFCG
jgi:hypothetical protein